MTPEERARETIDAMLEAVGWAVQDMSERDLHASRGVALREFPLERGFADYLLFVDGAAVGVIEAKAEGTTLSGVDTQSQKYLDGLPDYVERVMLPLPFAYESTGVETLFRDIREPDYRSRRVYSFHQPGTLAALARESDTLRERLTRLPPLITDNLRDCQTEAITGLEQSLAANRPRALIQMATGSGKTFTAVNASYRLIKHARAKRVLFLVDRGNLGRQTFKEFQQFVSPDDGRKFTELYNVQHLQGQNIDGAAKVCISTIQRLYSLLRGEALEPEFDELSAHELTEADERPRDVAYNPAIPPETFDVIIVDESHRSIYNVWRQVLEYFDAFLIGLTATPSKQTLGFFDANLVTEYNHERAVADGVNVGYDVYRIKTRIGEGGSSVEAGYTVDYRDKATRAVRWEQLGEDVSYEASELDRSVVAEQQIRTVVRAYRDKLFSELFPGRSEVPKTLVFAKNDSHAEDIVRIVREEFGKGNAFCKKITYRVSEKPDELIQAFRNQYHPRIAVTVDLISTGTDVKPLEALIFMRDVRSQTYFEQMVGRGTRTISETDLQAVTPDARRKTHFVLIDAVGVTETNKSTDVRPLERQRGVGFDKLLDMVSFGRRDADTLTSLANRLARLSCELEPGDAEAIQDASGGESLGRLTHRLLDAVTADTHIAHARATFGVSAPSEEQVRQAAEQLAHEAVRPFGNPKLREALKAIKHRNEQLIDRVSQDEVVYAGYDFDKAQAMVTNFRQFIEDNRDELLALQILYNQPYSQQRVTLRLVRELAEALEKPPYYLDAERLWEAYARLEADVKQESRAEKMLTNIISLVRYAIGKAESLEPYGAGVDRRFAAWLAQQEQARRFTPEQVEWLTMIKEHLAASLSIEPGDFEHTPFVQKGGRIRAARLFGPELPRLLGEMNEVLGA